MLRAALFLTLLLCCTHDALAQAPDLLAAGDRVRVRIGHQAATYTVVAFRGDSLFLRADADADSVVRAVRFSVISRIDRSLGRRSAGSGVARGAGLGLLLGGLTGAAVGFALGSDEGADDVTAGEMGAIWAGVGGACGVVAGAFLGAMAPGERWVRLDTAPIAPIVSVQSRQGGVGIGVRYRF